MSFKDKASEALKEGNYTGAINFYTLALKNEPSNSKLFSSRAKAYYLNLQTGSSNPTQAQWKKIADDCSTSLSLDKDNYDAIYYNALVQSYGYKRLEKGLKLLNEAYTKSLSRVKQSKHYSLPQEIYMEILKLKANIREMRLHENLANANPFFNKLVYLLQQEYERKLKELMSKDMQKPAFDYATTKLAVEYNNEIKQLIDMFELKRRNVEEQHKEVKELKKDEQKNGKNNNSSSSSSSSSSSDSSIASSASGSGNSEKKQALDVGIEAPEYLCDPISFNIFHDPVITPSGQSFERSWLFQYLSSNECDPLTRQKLTKEDCYPNLGLKACADRYLEDVANHSP
ncbi:hypothetical protein PVL30_005149 [Lodderomyces elongisporus]|uniref:uncharacterized protein n=1 Tax=Lodderomyces elongisporus TaxID=36914 RepID=UPI00291DCDD7|nr:uncharacterized protein PVL30_005149 [Lodderomyces elongisporus]WLF81352.1 hypothetical protein PVL30_005149 [Lodderomyces elongisporus]